MLQNKADSFTFHGSFLRAIEAIPDEQARTEALWAIVEYGVKGIRKNVSQYAAVVLELAIPVIDSSHKKYKENQEWKEFNKANKNGKLWEKARMNNMMS